MEISQAPSLRYPPWSASGKPVRQELRSKRELLQNQNDNLDSKKRAMRNIENNLSGLNGQVEALETEMSSAFQKVLTEEEESQLESLNSS